VELLIVPDGDEVVEVAADGSEQVLPRASADDAFAAGVRQLQLSKVAQSRKRRRSDGQASSKKVKAENDADEMEIDEKGQDLLSQEGNRDDADETKTKGTQDPFQEVRMHLGMARYELQQMSELTKLLCDGSMFRLENLQADERSKVTDLSDALVAFEMKKIAFREVLKIVRTARDVHEKSRSIHKRYVQFIYETQKEWRLQPVAHGERNSTNLRAQEPLAVDCGFFSAGSRGKAARLRQTRNAARMVVTDLESYSMDSSKEIMTLDAHSDGLSTVRFSVEDLRNREILATAIVDIKRTGRADRGYFHQQLERLQQAEFCSELFQVLSVEAARGGEQSSSLSGKGAPFDPNVVTSYRPQVSVAESFLRKISISLDGANRALTISLEPLSDKKDCEGVSSISNEELHAFCEIGCISAQEHQRLVHKRQNKPFLTAMIAKFRQLETMRSISLMLKELAPSFEVPMRWSWVFGPLEYDLEISLGMSTKLNFKLEGGRLTLNSVKSPKLDQLPDLYTAALNMGSSWFASPKQAAMLRSFLLESHLEEAAQTICLRLKQLFHTISITSSSQSQRSIHLGEDLPNLYLSISAQQKVFAKLSSGEELELGKSLEKICRFLLLQFLR